MEIVSNACSQLVFTSTRKKGDCLLHNSRQDNDRWLQLSLTITKEKREEINSLDKWEDLSIF